MSGYAFKYLLNQKELCILYSNSWKGLWEKRFKNAVEDAETFSTDNCGYLLDIGEKLDCLSNAFGQYMGIISFTPKIFSIFKKIFYTLPEDKRNKIYVQLIPLCGDCNGRGCLCCAGDDKTRTTAALRRSHDGGI